MTLKQTRDITTLKNWDKNPRTIVKKDFERLKKQIQKLGEYKPLLITKDGTVLGGNMRLKAYQELGIKEVWVSVVEADTEEKKIEYALSDNDRAGKYELDLMGDMVGNFPDLDWAAYSIDIEAPKTVDKFIDMFPETEEDSIPEVVDDPQSKLGEVYLLGKHRLMCGDATKIEDVEKLMNGQKADMVFTDPPYGVKYEGRKNFDVIENDELDKTGLFDFLDVSFANLSTILKNGGCFYICSGWPTIKEFITATENKNLNLSTKLVWIKNNLGWGFADYRTKTEVILYGFKEGAKHYWCGDRDQSNLWEFNKDTEYKHPTQKPIALCSKAINNSSKQDDIVLDLFGGSGSTLIACEQTNRICYMMELDPKYTDVIRKRYAKFIGKEAEWQKVTAVVDQPL